MSILNEEEDMIAKNLIYLDEEKMYSISSQIFEGITEYILNEEREVVDKSETQKGPIHSGKVLADVLKKENSSTQTFSGRLLNEVVIDPIAVYTEL